VAEENVITGNVALYGARPAEAYIRGMAGERFASATPASAPWWRASATTGCEYMTGGRVVVIGKTGRNFAAGMSGGIAYVLAESGEGAPAGGGFERGLQQEMVQLFPLSDPSEMPRSAGCWKRHVE